MSLLRPRYIKAIKTLLIYLILGGILIVIAYVFDILLGFIIGIPLCMAGLFKSVIISMSGVDEPSGISIEYRCPHCNKILYNRFTLEDLPDPGEIKQCPYCGGDITRDSFGI